MSVASALAFTALSYVNRTPVDLCPNHRRREIWIVGWIGRAQENIIAAEGDIVISAAMRRRPKRINLAHSVFRIDDDKVRAAVFVLHCPQVPGSWIHAQSVIVPNHGVGSYQVSVHLVFDNRAALAVGAVRRSIVSVADKNMVVEHGHRVGCRVNPCHAGGKR